MVLEKTPESPLDCKEIQPVNPKGNKLWLFFGRTDAEAEAPVLWLSMWRSDSLERTLMLGKMESMRRRRPLRMTWLDGIINLVDRSLSVLPGIVKAREAWHAAVYGVTKSQTWLSIWTTNFKCLASKLKWEKNSSIAISWLLLREMRLNKGKELITKSLHTYVNTHVYIYVIKISKVDQNIS